VFRWFALGYSAMRLAVEFIKPTDRRYAGLSAIQLACLAAIFVCVRWLLTQPDPALGAPDAKPS
jgi:prolipoprotein diacylglyceryltransferase